MAEAKWQEDEGLCIAKLQVLLSGVQLYMHTFTLTSQNECLGALNTFSGALNTFSYLLCYRVFVLGCRKSEGVPFCWKFAAVLLLFTGAFTNSRKLVPRFPSFWVSDHIIGVSNVGSFK